ncbi:MAG: mannose-1-phosphate guanylyltransferase [Nitrospirota bacterium]|nr:mannose-1-phosphate guanylyltransferase [Nitrospirota bacterium]
MKDTTRFYAVILAGGSGIRLWPLSRATLPKQLIPVLSEKSLLEEAFDRLEGVLPVDHRWVCGGARYEAVVRERIPALSTYIGEPVGRDTLAAIGYCCALAAGADPEAIVAFLTSDHVIRPLEEFSISLSLAFALVEENPDILLTFGVKPTFPATAYGYLELSEPLADDRIRLVRRFKEKPDRVTAEQYCAVGDKQYLWNSGMFVWRASRFLELLKRYEPEVADAVAKIAAESDPSARATLMAEIYPDIKKKSVDYGVMEPASHDPDVRIACIPLDLEWKDIGSWTTYGSLAQADESGNASMVAASCVDAAPLIFQDTSNTLIVSSDPSHLIACLGCEDIVVVHTADATLICLKSKVEDIKKLYGLLNDRYK